MLEPLKASDRATVPLLRGPNGELKPVDWETAIDVFTSRFKQILKKYGQESVAFLSTGQLLTEEMIFLGALAKFGMGLIHGDGNTRQCMATAATAHKQSFGFDAPPYTYKDFEESDVLVFIGSNLVIAHPIMWNRVKKNKHDPTVIVVDPRHTETASKAAKHYPTQPDSLLTLLYGLAHILIKNDWVEKDFIEKHTTGFESFRDHVSQFHPGNVNQKCGLHADDLEIFAHTIHKGKRVSFWWTMGVNQNYQGVACAQAIINLALMTGNIGKPGTGANSITGQCNAMGSRLFSNTTGLFAGYSFENSSHRKKIADILGIDSDLIPKNKGWRYDEILKAVDNETIKGLWIICTNPAHSWINKNWLLKVFKKLDFLVVQDMYHTTETAVLADLVLPAAGCGEKEGIFINSERRLGVVKKISEPPGQALPDFDIFKRIVERWGCADIFKEWSSPAAVFEILKRVSRGTPCDISGIDDYSHIDQQGGIQWPYPEGAEDTGIERRLFTDGRFYHPDGRAKFLFHDIEPVPEQATEEYPFVLITGRGSVAQWHTQTRTGKVEKLRKLYPSGVYLEINPDDAERLNIEHGEMVTVRSKRDTITVCARVSEIVGPGQVFLPMHYFETNCLTKASFDPFSGQPSYKIAAVDLRPKNTRDETSAKRVI
jgi:assimilatory nitrate reductase catalytic subunit